jgi:hypothetical protein
MLMMKPRGRYVSGRLLPANGMIAQAAPALILSSYGPHEIVVEKLTPKISCFIDPAL